MPSPITVIVNASAKQARDATDRLADVFASSEGIEAEIAIAHNGAEVTKLARRAARNKSRLIVAGGGDGTVSAVAAELVHTGKPLAVLPLGTLNHFAKDLKIPLELEAAVKTIREGQVVSIDVGEVNGRFFLNNSSLGIYPGMVREREQQQERGRSKWFALLSAALAMVHRYPVLSVRLKADGRELVRRTSIVFVGNNQYELEGLKMGTRHYLNRGLLHLYVMRHTGIGGLLRLFVSALVGKLRTVKEFDAMCVKELWIEARRRRLHVAVDGEVMVLRAPLYYRTHPAALRVVVPKTQHEQREQAANAAIELLRSRG
jgi:diacylglycerol kinase family enzyme